MSLDQKFIPIRTAIYEIVGNFFEKIAGLFGYPTSPGMQQFITCRMKYLQNHNSSRVSQT
jgi:hypothetical protein